MNKILAVAALLAFLPFVGCHKPEVIPAPTEALDLKQHFTGTINGTGVEWTENVNGYKVFTENSYILDTANYIFNWRFYSSMQSLADVKSISIGIGSLQHDPSVSADPSISDFKNFVMKFADPNTAPDFSDEALDGFQVIYRDAAGDLLKSDESDPGTYSFSNVQYKEDKDGEYMTFVCTFSAPLYDYRLDTATNMDTVYKYALIENAKFTGYFKRKNN